jgi:hypothetical protein
MAMWSVRYPSTDCSRAMLSTPPVLVAFAMLIHTTSPRLGRDTARCLPSVVANMSSTNWSCPSPGSSRTRRKSASRAGFRRMSRSSCALSGTRLTPVLSTSREFSSMIVAVPAQLLPTHMTSRKSTATWVVVSADAGLTTAAPAPARLRASARLPRTAIRGRTMGILPGVLGF